MTNATSGSLDQLYTIQHMQEFAKCALDPIYFIEKYCFIETAELGKILFKPYHIQKQFIDFQTLNKHLLLLGSRQVGISDLLTVLSLHEVLFKSANIIYVTTKEQIGRMVCSHFQSMFHSLPDWMKLPAQRMNGNEVNFYNGGCFLSTASRSGILGKSPNLLIVDNAQFLNEETWNTIEGIPHPRTIVAATGSTERGPDGFKLLLSISDTPKSIFKKFLIHWSDIPGRDYGWKQDMCRRMGEAGFEREYGALV